GMDASCDLYRIKIIKGYVRNGNETVMAGLERGIDPLEYVFECRDVVHMDNLLVYLKDLIFEHLMVKQAASGAVKMS
ncbi:MAG: hypothetical protein NWR42_04935, partial [Desulfobacterales bacterium]|nr:hypothetical protein [Desulfobacterales bacterium]